MEQKTDKKQTASSWYIAPLLIGGGALFCAAIVWLFSLFFSPIYRAELDVLLKPSSTTTAFAQGELSSPPLSVAHLLDNYTARVRADALIRQALRQQLPAHYDFDSHVTQLQRAVSVTRTKDGLHITVNANKPEIARRLANILGTAYGDAFRSFRDEDASALLVQWKGLDQAIRDTRLQQTADMAPNLNIAVTRQFVARYVEAVTTRLYLDVVIEMVAKCEREQLSPLGITEIATSPVIRAKVDRLSEIEAESANLRVQLGAKSAKVRALSAEYDVVEDQLSDEISQIIRNFSSDRDIAAQTEQGLKQILLTPLSPDKKSTAIEKDSDALITLIAKKMTLESEIAAQNFKVDVSAVSLANYSGYTHTRQAVITTFLIALAGFTALALFLKFFEGFQIPKPQNNMPKRSTQVQSLENEKVDDRQAVEKTLSSKNILEGIRNHQLKIIALFGATAEEQGARIALKAFKIRRSTVLIDIAGSEITRQIGVHTGLSDVLTGEASLEEAIHQDPETGVDILPNGRVSSLRAAAFSHRFPSVLKKLQETYSVIVMTVAAEPFLTLPDLLEKGVQAIIVEGRDSKLWEETLLEAGFADFKRLI